MSRKKKHLSKKKIVISLFIVVVVIFCIYFLIPKEVKLEYVTAVAERGLIKQTVLETGVVKLPKMVDLNFGASGKVSEVLVSVGDKVEKSDVIAMLDSNVLEIREREALANLEIAKTNLLKLKAGATSEDVAISEANVASAMSAHKAAKNELEKIQASVSELVIQNTRALDDLWSTEKTDITVYEQAIKLAQTGLENAKITHTKAINDSVNNALIDSNAKLSQSQSALDSIAKILNDSDAKSLLSIKNSTYLDLTKLHNSQALNLIDVARALSDDAEQSSNKRMVVAEVVNSSILAVTKTFDALKSCFNVLENTITSLDFTQTELNTYKSEVNSQLTVISVALSSLESKKQALNSAILSYDTNINRANDELSQARVNYNNAVTQAENALSSSQVSASQQIQMAESRVAATEMALIVAQTNLDKIKAPTNIHDVSLAKSQIDQAQAVVDSVREQLKDTQIFAPFVGTISKINFEVGEQVNSSQVVVTLLGDSRFEIEVLISETDIFKVKNGDYVNITLDALSDDVVFEGKVDFIEPAETRIQDVIYYKVKVVFNSDSSLAGVMHGMTANLEILTANKDDVLVVPSRAILDGNGRGLYVRILDRDEVNEKNVIVGLRGDGGQIEILRGVNEGDVLVLYEKK